MGITSSTSPEATPVATDTHPIPPIEADFCGAHDHILIGVGGSRWGVYEWDRDGLFAQLELWATDDDVESIVDAAVAGDQTGRGVCLFVRLTDEGLRTRLQDHDFAAHLKTALVAEVKRFRARDPEYLTRQAEFWRSLREGSW